MNPPKIRLTFQVLHISRDHGLVQLRIPAVQKIIDRVLEDKLLVLTGDAKINDGCVEGLASFAREFWQTISCSSWREQLHYVSSVFFCGAQHWRAIKRVFDGQIGFWSR